MEVGLASRDHECRSYRAGLYSLVSRDTRCAAGNGDGNFAARIAHAHSLLKVIVHFSPVFRSGKIITKVFLTFRVHRKTVSTVQIVNLLFILKLISSVNNF